MARDKRVDTRPVAEVEDDDDDVEETVVVRKPKAKDVRPVRRFKLKAGWHTQKSKDPNKPYMYAPGSIVESRADLVKIHGHEKFEEIGTSPSAEEMRGKNFRKYPAELRTEQGDTKDDLDNLTGGARTVNETNRLRKEADEDVEDEDDESTQGDDAADEAEDSGVVDRPSARGKKSKTKRKG